MANLPTNLSWDMADDRWASQINPIISRAQNNSLIIKNVELSIGINTINHGLGQKLQGWNLTRKRGPASIYDAQDTNQMPQLTLTLVSDAAVSIDLEVF